MKKSFRGFASSRYRSVAAVGSVGLILAASVHSLYAQTVVGTLEQLKTFVGAVRDAHTAREDRESMALPAAAVRQYLKADGVSVAVFITGEAIAAECGIDRATLTAQATAALRKAGVKVVSAEAVGGIALSINISRKGDGPVFYDIELQYRQPTYLPPVNLIVNAATWSVSHINLTDVSVARAEVKKDAAELLDRFTFDYRQINPKEAR